MGCVADMSRGHGSDPTPPSEPPISSHRPACPCSPQGHINPGIAVISHSLPFLLNFILAQTGLSRKPLHRDICHYEARVRLVDALELN